MAGFSIHEPIDLELEAMLAENKMRRQMQGEAEGDQACEQRNPGRQLAAIGQDRDQNRAGQRDQQDQREN